MRCVNSLRKKAIKLFFARLIKNVKNKKIRPFCVDEQGLWFKTQYGFFVYSNLKDRILELDKNAAWEEIESSFIVNNLKDGDVFVDVGANIGYFSILAALQKAGKVLAIEPAPKAYEMLNMNIIHNGLTDVIEPFNIALGSKECTAKLVFSLGPKSHIEYEVDNIHANMPTVSVNVTTLDNFIKNKKEIKRIDFVKVDIEGYEYDFLIGARKTIEAFKPVILMEVEEHRLVKYSISAEKVFNFMNDLGYKYLFIAEDSIAKGGIFKGDLKKARNFIFYTGSHNLIY